MRSQSAGRRLVGRVVADQQDREDQQKTIVQITLQWPLSVCDETANKTSGTDEAEDEAEQEDKAGH